MDDEVKKVLSKLEALCSKREYCSSDILDKARKALDGSSSGAEEILSSLVRDGYVSDLRYASSFAREKASLTGWGPAKIRFALSGKKIPLEIIDEALGEIDTDKAASRLERLLQIKWKYLQGDPQGKLKLIKYALGRGYGYDQIRDIADRIARNG